MGQKRPCREPGIHKERRISGTLFVVPRTAGHTGQLHGRVIAFGPAGPLKSVSTEGNDDYGHEQGEKGDPVDSEDGHVMVNVDSGRNGWKQRIAFYLTAQSVVARRDARDHDSV